MWRDDWLLFLLTRTLFRGVGGGASHQKGDSPVGGWPGCPALQREHPVRVALRAVRGYFQGLLRIESFKEIVLAASEGPSLTRLERGEGESVCLPHDPFQARSAARGQGCGPPRGPGAWAAPGFFLFRLPPLRALQAARPRRSGLPVTHTRTFQASFAERDSRAP